MLSSPSTTPRRHFTPFSMRFRHILYCRCHVITRRHATPLIAATPLTNKATPCFMLLLPPRRHMPPAICYDTLYYFTLFSPHLRLRFSLRYVTLIEFQRILRLITRPLSLMIFRRHAIRQLPTPLIISLFFADAITALRLMLHFADYAPLFLPLCRLLRFSHYITPLRYMPA